MPILFKYFKNFFFSRKRSLIYSKRSENRFWWYKLPDVSYIPPLYSFLTMWEWSVIESWYEDTNSKNLIGESAVPIMSVIQGFFMGSSISRIVQLGHYSGYSTLLIGFMLRRMGKKKSLFTIDIDPNISKYTHKWVNKAGLEDYVRVQVGNSSAPAMVESAVDYLKGKPQIIFIDSSHQYEHTLQEIDLWYPQLEKGGLIFMHDTSIFASQYDSTKQGGVKRAFEEWKSRNPSLEMINICNNNVKSDVSELVYRDGCGLGIIQK